MRSSAPLLLFQSFDRAGRLKVLGRGLPATILVRIIELLND